MKSSIPPFSLLFTFYMSDFDMKKKTLVAATNQDLCVCDGVMVLCVFVRARAKGKLYKMDELSSTLYTISAFLIKRIRVVQ